ncbi:MAG: archease, partial [Elusimicrobia bacterium]|nr:archease [Elusimicrobiota bacterium]
MGRTVAPSAPAGNPPPYEYLDHTADIGILAYGKTLPELFVHAAEGMCSLIADLNTVALKQRAEVSLEAPDREVLLVAWLNELLYLLAVQKLIGARFHIHALTDNALKGSLEGEPFDRQRHRPNLEIKATTYHELSIR